MADPTTPVSESAGTTIADAGARAGSFVANTAKAIGQSVVDDGKNLVGKDVALGTRVEAGLNIAADVSSFVVGPEDMAAERAAVFGVKEAAEHAPQLIEGAELAAKTIAEKAPEIAKIAVSDFDLTKSLLVKGGHELLDSHPEKGLLETKNALYKVLEQTEHKGERTIVEVASAGREAFEKGKNFAVHAEKLPEAIETGIKNLGQEGYHELKGLKATLSTSEMQIEKSIGTMERSPLLERGKHLLEKGQEKYKAFTEGFETAEKLVKTTATVLGAGAAIEFVEDHGHKAAVKAEHVIGQAEHAVGHVASEAEHHVAAAAKSVVDEVKSWSPEMPFEQFGQLMNKIRGVAPQSHAVPTLAGHEHEQQPTKAKTPHKAPEFGHGL